MTATSTPPSSLARRTVLSLLAAAALLPGAAGAHDYKLKTISIGHIWGPPTAEGADGAAVFGPIFNRGQTADRLLSATSPIAETVRFRTVENGEVHWLDSIPLPPGRPVSLAEWREHLWLEGLTAPVEKGADFDMTLEFENAGSIDVTVVVEDASGH